MKCSICNSDKVSSHSELESITYKKANSQVPMQYSLCGHCGHEFVPASQIKLNDKAVLQAKRMADDMLLPEEFAMLGKA